MVFYYKGLKIVIYLLGMRETPESITIGGEEFFYEKILKDDFFSVNVLYKSESGRRYVIKLSDFRFIFGVFLRPLAQFFSRREYRIYEKVKDISGVPALGPRFGKRGYFHFFVEGITLHEYKGILPDDFFNNLKEIIDEVHRRRIFYLDLNKLGNIIVGTDNKPYLIDFQVSIYFKPIKWFLVGRVIDWIFNKLIREDIYHLYKHKKRFRPDLITPEELSFTKRTGFNKWYNMLFGQPYRKVKRMIYPSGSNEIIWYKWRKVKDKSKTMP
ncbi:MAG: hypothetical protein HQK88_16765 [Nitrospirae bacterium]|nr:hypothetical protein [Nitrospirota bacterium]MBF0536470.1 hypothetical protein [Nitrospirota bacterium]MBF0618452.1 hypothetical protein [Nitrospirota bacterium]